MPHGALFTETRARKKKALTDQVELLPFPEQSLREKKAPVKIKAEIKSIPQEKHAPKIVAKKTKINSEHLSIKQILKKEREANEKTDLVLPREKIDIQKALILWRQYAYQTKDKGKETYYNALVKRDPLFESNERIKIVVDNQIQVDYIKPLLNELITFLREKLMNHYIEIIIELSEAPEEDVKYLNGKDKFEVLAQKNPKLNTLKKLFNLDIEY